MSKVTKCDVREIRSIREIRGQKRKSTKSQKKVHFLPAKSPLSSRRKSTFFSEVGKGAENGKCNNNIKKNKDYGKET